MTYHLTNYEFKIGLEIHIELKTTLKMFSNSLSMSEFLDKYQIFLPNLFVDEVDLGYPGSLPVVNYHAVKLGYVLAHLLKMDYKPILYFDRKNYFYYDLPKGYQITQFYKPLAINGTMLISNKQQQPKTIKITEIHLEEDTAKNLKSATHIKLDYNRCGIPLIEIVTAPDFVDADEVIDFLKRLTNLLNYYGISDAQMHRGSLRCDVNISINKVHELTLGNRIEIKNLNSYESIKMAIAFEMNQQFNAVTNNEVIMSATKTYLPATKATLFLRNKTTVDGYHYMPEINLPPIHVPASLISETKQFVTHHQMFIDHTNVNYEQIFAETYQLPLTMANVLINNHALLNIFYHTIHLPTLSLLIGHWLCNEHKIWTNIINDSDALSSLANIILFTSANLKNNDVQLADPTTSQGHWWLIHQNLLTTMEQHSRYIWKINHLYQAITVINPQLIKPTTIDHGSRLLINDVAKQLAQCLAALTINFMNMDQPYVTQKILLLQKITKIMMNIDATHHWLNITTNITEFEKTMQRCTNIIDPIIKQQVDIMFYELISKFTAVFNQINHPITSAIQYKISQCLIFITTNIDHQQLSHEQAKDMLNYITDQTMHEAVPHLHQQQTTNEADQAIITIIEQIIAQNHQLLMEYKNYPKRIYNVLMSQLNQTYQQKLNYKIVGKLLQQAIDEKLKIS